jgi:hypothetical protein
VLETTEAPLIEATPREAAPPEPPLAAPQGVASAEIEMVSPGTTPADRAPTGGTPTSGVAPSDPTPEPTPAPRVEPPPGARPPLLVWLAGLAFLVLAGSQAALWVRVLFPPPGSGSLEQRVRAFDARLTELEQRPTPQAPDLGALTARVAALEQRPSAGGAVTPSKPTDLAPLEARIATLELRSSVAASGADSLAARMSADEKMLAALAQSDPAQLAQRAKRIARIQAAAMALALGQPLGVLPDAPQALTRYATDAPPTEAGLRLAFPAAARAALAADHAVAPDTSFGARVWATVQELITVRRGDHVVVGDAAAEILARARTSLDAGDLAGAAAIIGTLDRPTALALAGWLDQVNGLLAARAALAALAAQT